MAEPETPSAGRLLVHDHQYRPLTVTETVRRRRDTRPDNPSLWAAHVHSGA
ncbi:hypothetical protein ACWC24_15830 [Streptomyces sp. NPDC001443]